MSRDPNFHDLVPIQPRWQTMVAVFSLPHMSSLSFGMITCADWQLNVVYQHLYA